MKKLLLIMNPCAGTKKANRHLPEIISLFNRADFEVICHMTAHSGDGESTVAQRAKDVDLIVCIGGDGTFNETVSGVLRSGAEVPVGYIPAGSTNDFANSLKLPTNILKAAQHIIDSTPVPYDVGLFGDRHFTYVASFGAFTRASYATPQSVKNALGHTAYILGGISELSQIRKTHVRLELEDGTVIEDDFIFGAISNSTVVGGVLTLDPQQVDMQDGKFELMLIRSPRSLKELSKCIHALTKHQYNCEMITFLSASRVKITADPNMNWTLDGEMEPGHEVVEVTNLQHALRMINGRPET